MFGLLLVDINEDMVNAWREYFSDVDVEVYHGSILFHPADALVSPANSFGFMNGGIDAVYSNNIGLHLQYRVQEEIKKNYNGELLIGQALEIPTDNAKWPVLIAAPTMRIPAIIHDTTDVYLSTKAALRIAFNKGYKVAMPGMGTATGAVHPRIAAKVMRAAYDDIVTPPAFPMSLMDAVSSTGRFAHIAYT